MTKKKKIPPKKTEEKRNGSFNLNSLIPEKYQTVSAFAVIVLLIVIFFNPLFFGNKTFQSGDIITIKSMRSYIEKERDGFTLWNPYIFCGLPAHATGTALRWWDFIGAVYSKGKGIISGLLGNDFAGHTINLMLIAFGSFIFMRSLKASRLVSLFVALATAFSTGIIVMVYIGHITKLISLAAFPIVLMLLLRMNKQIKLIDVILLVIALHFVVLGAHVQIIYYIFLTAAFFYIFYFITALIEKKNEFVKQLFKSAAVFTVASLIAVAMSYDSYSQLWEYNKYSTRGTKSIIEQQAKGKEKSESDFYNYATNWSFSPEEVLTFFVPSFYGFGNATYKGPLTQNRPVHINTYFGQMPFVDVAQYMGIVVFVLAILGIVLGWKNRFVQFLTYLNLIFLIVSFGRNMPLLYDLFFHYLPLFDKFRVPSMILNITQMTIPVLAGLGLMELIERRKKSDATLMQIISKAAMISGGMFVVALLFKSSLASWFIGHIKSAGQKVQQLQPLYDFMANMFTTDLLFFIALTGLTFAVIYFFLKKNISTDLMIILLLFFAMVDLMRIDSRGAHYVDKINLESAFRMPDYIKAIKGEKNTEPYRILNLKREGLGSVRQNSNYNVYFLEQDFYGYSSVKPRTYQDLIDVVGLGNSTLWRMLNVKYIVTGQRTNVAGFSEILGNKKTFVYRNENALPRAYFVDTVETKPLMTFLNQFKQNSVDPKKVAFLESGQIKIDKPDSTAKVINIDYKDEHITMSVNASGNNFLFLGDTYYPPGWKAYIDGAETQIYKANHGFRGIIVPPGKHKVEFIYAPASFFIGKYASLVLNILIIFALVAVYFTSKGKREAEEQS